MRRRVSLTSVALGVTALLCLPSLASAQSPIFGKDSSFLVSGLASSAAQQSSSGSPRHEGIGIGFLVGPTFSSFDQANSNFKNNNGLELGIFFGGNRAGTVGVEGKLMYVKKGAKNAAGVVVVDTRYLEIPILLRINAGSHSLNGVLGYFIAGPTFDILMKADAGGVDVKKNYQGLDLGLQIGGGVEITRFIIEASLTKGLRKINDGNLASLTPIKTRKFAIDFGIRFN